MIEEDHSVLVLDDDHSVLSGLCRLLGANGYKARVHSDADEFFRAGLPAVPSCLLLDNQLGNGMSGLEVHAEMLRRGWNVPTVFLTAHWNVKAVVSAMRSGADDFLTKPFDPDELLSAVSKALNRARQRLKDSMNLADVRAKAATLTSREREIVGLIVAGLLNKEIANRLDLALVTVKVHRGRAMQKLGAGNAAELAHIAALAGIVD